MQQVLAITLAAMQQDMNRIDRVALNMANVSTPGYKREVIAARPFIDAMDDAAATTGVAHAGGRGTDAAAPTMAVLFNTKPGTLKNTGEPFDVAISGNGYFEVATDHGPAYTRQGNFQTDAHGRLVTAQGYAVMGKAGEIYLTTPTPVIDQAGNITEPNAVTGPSTAAPGTPLAQLKLVRFDADQGMARLGGGLLAAGTGMTVMSDADVSLRQGSLENSNVETMQEMTQLIQTMRHFESMQKVAQGYDDMLGTAIHRLGDLS